MKLSYDILARAYEKNGDNHQAIRFFSLAFRFNHAIRLAIVHDLQNELLMLALRSPPNDVITIGVYM
jgi:hypothetical protein